MAATSPLITNPEGAIRDFAEAMTNGNRDIGPDDRELGWLEEWAKNEAYLKVIMEVIKARIELNWPYNYKALLILGKMPAGELVGLAEKLGKLNDAPATMEGAKHLKELAKPLNEKAKAEIAKKEEADAKAKQEAIQAMWGGLWANNSYTAPALQSAGWMGWPYPYSVPPGVARGAMGEWAGKPPDGWKPTPITALPQIYPFSRTGYYGLQPEPPKDAPKAPVPMEVYVNLGPQG
ncbi:hypothetical protein IAT40_003277 [Kwoniella sp. CBS 6097]